MKEIEDGGGGGVVRGGREEQCRREARQELEVAAPLRSFAATADGKLGYAGRWEEEDADVRCVLRPASTDRTLLGPWVSWRALRDSSAALAGHATSCLS